MTALTSDAQRVEKEGKLLRFPVKAATLIYKNALVKIGADGYAAPCSAEAGAAFAGMGYEKVDNSAGAAGAETIRLELRNAFEVAGAGFVQADLLKEVYAADDNLVQLAAGTNLQKVGRIVEIISATKVLVQPIMQAR